MSEIQSIAQNNYILHNIDAKKLYVQEPLFTANSGDAVYVGWRPDETVLYSGIGTSAATISEPLSAFEMINIYMNRGDGNVGQAQSVLSFRVRPNDTYVQLNWSLGANGWYNVFQKLTWTNNSVNVVSAHAIYGGSFTSTAISHESNTTLLLNTIQKVVGINRKENA